MPSCAFCAASRLCTSHHSARRGSRRHLLDNDPAIETRNKFRLRRTSDAADYELRVEDLRVFYRVAEADVLITMIGRKRGNVLIVRGKEYVI